MKQILNYVFLFIWYLGSTLNYAQTQPKDVVDALRFYKLSQAQTLMAESFSGNLTQMQWQMESLINSNTLNASPPPVGLKDKNPYQIFYYDINLGDHYLYGTLNNDISAFDHYKRALSFAQSINNEILGCEALKKILTLHRLAYLYNNDTHHSYLDLYDQLAYDSYERANWHYFNLILKFKNYYTDKWEDKSYKILSDYLENHDTPFLAGISYTVFASYFEEMGDFEKVWFYLNLADEQLKNIPYEYKDIRLNQLNLLAARIAAKQGKTEQLDTYLKRFVLPADESNMKNRFQMHNKSLLHFYTSVRDSLTNNFQSAYTEYRKFQILQDSLDRENYRNLLNDLEYKYKTAEKEKQLLAEQQLSERRKTLLIAAMALVLVVLIISSLVFRNQAKKRLLAEQEAVIKQQKVETILKEQELRSIDAMIAGQEKERQKVADELHDDLGSLMATIKLHLNHGIDNTAGSGLNTAKVLLEQAYQKIRGMAHTKNSGVISDKGLVPAVEKMAAVISGANDLTISVHHYGMVGRMENSLELTIFRIIQELFTNIIKHSEATKATIQLTQHEDILNIIVEDNGKGFDNSKIVNGQGMGLTNIEKRVEHLEGTFDVDSLPNKGTSILIDIPV